MIVANLAPIKNTNGLYYYALEYLRRLGPSALRAVLVRPQLAAAASAALNGARIVPVGNRERLGAAMRSIVAGDFIYTPTPHPWPFLSAQCIVVHDAYPFIEGPKAALKRRLLKASLATSRCGVACINRSDAMQFARSLGVRADRLRFAPNIVAATGAPWVRSAPAWPRPGPLMVGLVGTDSPKKNYDALFAAAGAETSTSAAESHDAIAFLVYGHPTRYHQQVVARHPGIDIRLVPSDGVGIEDFLGGIDVLASVAQGEGFGRPIAAALAGGVPCVLVESPVFREFFSTGAVLLDSAASVYAELRRMQRSGRPLDRPRWVPAADVASGAESMLAWLRQRAVKA